MIGESLQRVVAEEISAAIELLAKLSEANALHNTHEARRRFKKTRALLRMIRGEVGEEAFAAENARFRDAGRRLRDLRDSQSLLKTLDAVSGRFFERRPALAAHARRLFMDDERRRLEHVTQPGAGDGLLAALEAALARSRQWNLKAFRWKEARRAIERLYKHARAARKTAGAKRSAETLHEWRKRVKDLWLHAGLLHKACPRFLKEFAHELEVLADFLGDDHDLAMLSAALEERREVLKRPRQFAALQKMIAVRKGELIDTALDLGERLFEERPAEFGRGLNRKRASHRRTKRKTKKLAARLTLGKRGATGSG